jgi:hypothetical protein
MEPLATRTGADPCQTLAPADHRSIQAIVEQTKSPTRPATNLPVEARGAVTGTAWGERS